MGFLSSYKNNHLKAHFLKEHCNTPGLVSFFVEFKAWKRNNSLLVLNINNL
jgi:hypothetical protein